jgi:hypothetical protein
MSTAIIFVTFSWGRLFLTGDSPEAAGRVLIGILTGVAVATAGFVPFLLAVLAVVASPNWRSVAGGTLLVYVVDLSVLVGRAILSGVPEQLGLVVLAVPLSRVAIFLAIAVAVWLAYHGGYERLSAAAGRTDQHPLFALVADKRIGPNLSLQRGLVVAGLASLVGAGGLALAGGTSDILRTIARSRTTGGVTVVAPQGVVWNVGIPLSQFPELWLFEASFLLSVLFVTGPRLRVRDLLKGIAVVFGVQSTVKLVPALLLSSRPLELWAVSGPVLTPMGDAFLLFGIAVAVRLAFHGNPGTLRRFMPSTTVFE